MKSTAAKLSGRLTPDILFALVTALRTGNLDSFFLEHGESALYALS